LRCKDIDNSLATESVEKMSRQTFYLKA